MELERLWLLASLFCCVTLAAVGAGNAAAAERPLTSADTFLAIDNSVFDKVEGLSIGVCEARRYERNPVLTNRPDGPDSLRAGMAANVILDNGVFRMWYTAHDGKKYRTAYAESDDGYTWRRPNLGIAKYNGADSNILIDEMAVLLPFRDDADPDPKRRYKSAYFGMVPEHLYNAEQKQRYVKSQPSVRGFAFSPDGIHWTTDFSNEYPVRAKLENAVTYRLGDRFFLLCQMILREYPQVAPYSRFLGVAYSDDNMKTWKLADEPAFHFDAKYGAVIQTHIGPSYQNYGNVIVGAQGLFQNHPELVDHQAELITILTNDGLKWRQPTPHQPLNYLLRRGEVGTWDHHFNMQVGLVNAGQKTLLFYAAKPDGGNTPTGGHQVGVAHLRLDGYGYLAPVVAWNYSKPTFTGLLLTKPIQLADKGLGLYLNTTGAREGDELKVELQDEKGTPIPGFTLADCDNVTVDGVGVPVTWKGSASLDSLANRAVRVKFHVQGANPNRDFAIRTKLPHLYGFYFTQPTLWLKGEQAVLPGRGLERASYLDATLPRLRGVQVEADQPVNIAGRKLDDTRTELTFSADAQVTIRWPAATACSLEAQSVEPSGGAFVMAVKKGQKAILTHGAVTTAAK